MHDNAKLSARAFHFLGDWREFAPIALTNLLLTLVTFGIYSFWAKTRERRYLWSRTQFIDDRLEWTGTGKELFMGYLLAVLFILVPLAIMNFVVQGVAVNGSPGFAALILLLVYLGILALVGVATFRALRYRLSRTYWHGIRGGSDEKGGAYGIEYMWRSIVGALALGLMIPWALTKLWNRRWESMSFGPYAFGADAKSRPLMRRYLLFYVAPILSLVIIITLVSVFLARDSAIDQASAIDQNIVYQATMLFAVIWYLGFGLLAIAFYAAYFREAIGSLSLGDLQFEFDARTKDWLKLILGHVLLVVFTLGIGYVFIGYRNWSFFARHLNAYGTIDLDALTQSETRAPRRGEGLFEAFDMGAT